MKFRNPETGHEASDFTHIDCYSLECDSCPVHKLAQENGYSFCADYANKKENLIHAASLLGYYPVETFRERLEREHPECIYINGCGVSGCKGCPEDYGYEKQEPVECDVMTCEECWNRIIPMKEYEEEKKMGIKEGDIVRLKKKVVEAGGGMYNDLTVTLGMVKALDGKKFEVCATGTDETWCIKTDGIMDGFIIGEDALELVKEETEEKGMEIKDSGERREYLGGLNKIGDKRGMCGTHGMSHTRIYSIWTDMKRRCYNPRNKRYSRYGERGIEVCEEWKNDFTKFYDWAVKNGYEDALTIERKDINKEYCPENCCWITFKNQQRNTSRTHWITFGGETKSLAEWSEITGLSQGLIKDRINKLHWSIEETLTIPKMKIGGKKCHK